jgi:hypothetical protein
MLLALGALLSRQPAFAADSTRRATSALEGVAGLEKPVTYTETKIPLGELARMVAADTGVPLTAARSTTDTPVAVVVKELPARLLLEQLAELLDYRWSVRSGVQAPPNGQSPQQKGDAGPERLNARTSERPSVYYEIWQDVASKQREEALRQASLADTEQRLGKEIKRLTELAALSQEQIQRLLDENARRQQEIEQLPAEQQQALSRSSAEQERMRRVAAAQQLSSPVSRALGVFLGRLSAEHWTLLRTDQPLTFSSTPGAGELPMPAEVARLFRAARPTLFVPGMRYEFSQPGEEEQMRRREKEVQAQWSAASGYRATFRLDSSRLATAGSYTLQAGAEALRSGPVNPSPSLGGRGGSLFASAPRFDRQRDIATEETPERRARIEKDPVLGARKLFRLETKPRPAPYAPAEVVVWGVKEMLPDIARVYGVNIISDRYFNSAGGQFSAASLPTEPIALFDLLDRVVRNGQQWDLAGLGDPAGSGPPWVIRMRSRTWFLDRPKELPLRLVDRWKTLVEQQGALPLEEYVQMATTLNEGQLDIVAALVRVGALPPYTTGFYELRSGRNALRLYGSMTPTQRQALARGAAITVAQMTPTQQKLFLELRRERDRSRSAPLDPAEAAAGGLALTAAPLVLTVEHRGRTLNTRLEPLDKPAAPAEAEPPRAGAPVVAPPDRVERHPVTQLQLHLRYGPQVQEMISLVVARPG